jgi:hypothetical protein
MTNHASTDLAYLLRRAEQEAIAAIVTDQTPGSPIHRELARHYSVLAARALAGNAMRMPVS